MTVDLKDFCKIPPSQLEAESDFYRSAGEASRKYRLALIRLPKTLKASSLSGLSLEENHGENDCIGVFDSNGTKYTVKKSVFASEASLLMPSRGFNSKSASSHNMLEPIPEVWHVEQDLPSPVATREKLESFRATRPAEGVPQPQLIRELLEGERGTRSTTICNKDDREQQPVKKKHKKH